jgi:hypothetical protein
LGRPDLLLTRRLKLKIKVRRKIGKNPQLSMKVEVEIEVKNPDPQLTSEVNPKTEDHGPKKENQNDLKLIKKRSQLNLPLKMPPLGKKIDHPVEDLVVVLKEEVCLQNNVINQEEVDLHF